MPNTPLSKEQRSILEHKVARIISSFNQYGKRTNGEKNDDANFLKYDGKFKQIMELIDNHVDAAVREARENELGLTLDGILGDTWSHSNPGSEEEFFRIHVEHVVRYLNARRSTLQSQPITKEDSNENI